MKLLGLQPVLVKKRVPCSNMKQGRGGGQRSNNDDQIKTKLKRSEMISHKMSNTHNIQYVNKHLWEVTTDAAANRKPFDAIYQAWDSVLSPNETLRGELQIRHAAEYFWRTSRCFIWWWNTVSNAWYYFSNKTI